jgi:hypothetical protein
MVAHDWNMKPSDFWDSDENDQAIMIAYTSASGDIDNFEQTKMDRSK